VDRQGGVAYTGEHEGVVPFLPPVLGFFVALYLAVVAVRARHWPGLALIIILWNLTFLVWLGWTIMSSVGHGS
jgi:hypothetical protein